MGWADGHLLSFDVETTHRDPLSARIVTASLVVIRSGHSEAVATEWLVAVDVDIPAEATEVHGVATDHAREHGRPLAAALSELETLLCHEWRPDVPLLAMNANYDLTVLARERDRCGMSPLVVDDRTPVIDLLVCDRQVDRYRPGSRKLESVCAHYGVPLGDAHNSTADALATARAAWKMAHRYPRLNDMDLAELHRCQRAWYREQCLGLADYWRTPKALAKIERDRASGAITDAEAAELTRTLPDRADDVERNANGWPMRLRPEEWSPDD